MKRPIRRAPVIIIRHILLFVKFLSHAGNKNSASAVFIIRINYLRCTVMKSMLKIICGVSAAAAVFALGATAVFARPKPRVPRLADGTTESWNEEAPDVTGDDTVQETETETEDESDMTDERDFIQKLYESMNEDENWFISPHSIKTALLMAANGAGGETKEQILSLLGVSDLDESNINAKEFKEKIGTSDDVTLETGDSIWINLDNPGGCDFSKEFKKLMKEYYSAEAGTVRRSDGADIINSWVSEKTHGRITKMVDSAEFDAIILDTIYMKADWESPFKERGTYSDIFHNADGSDGDIDFMHQTGYFRYADDGMNRIAILPYKGGDVSMALILGDISGDIGALLNKAEFSRTELQLAVPKFSGDTSLSLDETLKALGMTDAYDPDKADFTSMVTSGNMYISTILHKANIDIDEKGTEAAAATAIEFLATSAMPMEKPTPIPFICDVPFTYAVRDNETGEILFMGRFASAD